MRGDIAWEPAQDKQYYKEHFLYRFKYALITSSDLCCPYMKAFHVFVIVITFNYIKLKNNNNKQ